VTTAGHGDSTITAVLSWPVLVGRIMDGRTDRVVRRAFRWCQNGRVDKDLERRLAAARERVRELSRHLGRGRWMRGGLR
jgi:hypothetical protein